MPLGLHLTELQNEDPKRVFIARKIGSLGFESQHLITEHYSRYGKVLRVLIAQSKVKPFRNAEREHGPRIRPGSLGFVVMESKESIDRILSAGKDQVINGFHISVEPFELIAKPKESSNSTTDSTSTGGTPGSDGSASRSGSNGSEQECGSNRSFEDKTIEDGSSGKAENGSADVADSAASAEGSESSGSGN